MTTSTFTFGFTIWHNHLQLFFLQYQPFVSPDARVPPGAEVPEGHRQSSPHDRIVPHVQVFAEARGHVREVLFTTGCLASAREWHSIRTVTKQLKEEAIVSPPPASSTLLLHFDWARRRLRAETHETRPYRSFAYDSKTEMITGSHSQDITQRCHASNVNLWNGKISSISR